MASADQESDRSSLRWLVGWPVVVVLLGVHAALAIGSLRQKSATFDEMVRLTAGYGYWVTGDYRLDPAEPPLAQMWAALPLLGGDWRFPELSQPAWWIADAESIGRQFFFGLNNDVAVMLRSARTMIVLLSVALGALVYVASRRLFGPAGGLLSLLLYAVSPNLLAHARLVTTETATCLFFVAAVGGLWWVLHEVRPASVLASSAAMAGLFLSKMSAPLIIVVGAGMLAVRLVSGEPLRAGWGRTFAIQRRTARLGVWLGVMVIQVAATAGGLWAVHRFRYEAMIDAVPGRDRFCPPVPLPPETSSWDYVLSDAGTVGRLVDTLQTHRLLPEAYLYGVAFQSKAIGAGYGFLNGERRISGWWYFFPYALAVKTPPALFALLILAVVAAIWRRRAGAGRAARDPCATTGVVAILLFLGVYWGVALRSSLNIGHRHILPTYPFMIILAGGAAAWLRHRAMRWITGGCVGLFVLSAGLIWPDYLAYFNVLAGGPREGYKHLVDSSLDWGQDLPGLERWIDGHDRTLMFVGTPGPVYVSYFGTDNPERFGIDAIMLPSHMPWRPPRLESLKPGAYCISATMLQLMYLMPTNRWTEAYEAAYQVLKADVDRVGLTAAAAQWPAEEREAYRLLRFARLCAGLRRRDPTDQINHTILVYNVHEGLLREMLDGPPAETAPDDPVRDGPEQLVWVRRLARMLDRRGRREQAARWHEWILQFIPSDAEAIRALGEQHRAGAGPATRAVGATLE